MIRSLLFSTSLFAVAGLAQSPAIAVAAPADMALARDVATRLMPPGTYEKMMNGALSQMTDSMVQQMVAMPIAPIAKAAGMPEQEVAKLGATTLQQIMAILDPAYEQRMRIMMDVMFREMGPVMGRAEPELREGLAEAYAHRLTPTQLADLDRFLKTPSGSAYASQAMLIQTDPAFIEKMKAFMPELAQAMPGIMQKAAAATASLPKPKTLQQLSEDDRAKLAKLLGTTPDKLKKAPTP